MRISSVSPHLVLLVSNARALPTLTRAWSMLTRPPQNYSQQPIENEQNAGLQALTGDLEPCLPTFGWLVGKCFHIIPPVSRFRPFAFLVFRSECVYKI